MAARESKTATEKSEGRSRRPRNIFRGILEQLGANREMKVELGLLKPNDEVTELVRSEGGDIFAVSLKRVNKEK